MPRPILYVLLAAAALSLIPVGLVFKARATRGRDQTRIQVVYDMDSQVKFKAQSADGFFPDGRAMRLPPAGTVARGRLDADDRLFRGVERDTVFSAVFPLPVTAELMARGRDRFGIYCAPCHGASGNGDGIVNRRALALAEGTWTPPTDLTSAPVVERPVGHLFNTISNGIRSMPAYGPQIPVADRWAVVAYLRALQLSRNATVEDVPAAQREALR